MIVRMRGLPYATSAEQVVEFFASHKAEPSGSQDGQTEAVKIAGEPSAGRTDEPSIVEQKSVSTERMETSSEERSDLNNNHLNPLNHIKEADKLGPTCQPYCRVMHGRDGVLFVKRNGKPSGDCFVLFENEQQGQLALTKHRELIGARYIELFRSSTSEVQQIFNRNMDAVASKNGFADASQMANNAATAKSHFHTAKSFIPPPLHHQSLGSIYQPTASLALPMIGNQKAQQIAGQPATNCINGLQSTLQSTLQQQATAGVLQPTASLGHLHHAGPLGYAEHGSFQHHQLANHAQHPNPCFGLKQPHHATISSSNLATNGTHPYSHVPPKQHLLDSPPSTMGKPPPAAHHSLCTSSPVDSLNTSCNGNHQLIAAAAGSSNKSAPNGLAGVRPLLCVQPAAAQVLPTANHQPPQHQPPTNANQLTGQLTNFNSVRIKDWIRLRGLPYESSVEQILEFLDEHRSQIVYQGIHMIYNLNGQFSGEVFLQMHSEYAASQAALAKHHKYMLFGNGKKQRYIEVFQCTLDDMLIVLNGGQFINSNLLNGQLAMQRTLSKCTPFLAVTGSLLVV